MQIICIEKKQLNLFKQNHKKHEKHAQICWVLTMRAWNCAILFIPSRFFLKIMQIRTSAFEKYIKTSEPINKTYPSRTVLLDPPDFAKRLPEEKVLRATWMRAVNRQPWLPREGL